VPRARPNYGVVGPNYRVRFDSEPFVPSGFDRITVKTELSRAKLSSGDCMCIYVSILPLLPASALAYPLLRASFLTGTGTGTGTGIGIGIIIKSLFLQTHTTSQKHSAQVHSALATLNHSTPGHARGTPTNKAMKTGHTTQPVHQWARSSQPGSCFRLT
jgi:hypothetical protein